MSSLDIAGSVILVDSLEQPDDHDPASASSFPMRYSRSSQQQMKQRRSGYEPSDTETDWHETPRHDYAWKNDGVLRRNTSPMPVNRRQSSSRLESPTRDYATQHHQRRHSKSPYKQHRDEASDAPPRRSVSPFPKAERQRHVSPYRAGREEPNLDDDDDDPNPNPNRRRVEKEVDPMIQKPRRPVSAQRLRARENGHTHTEQTRERTPSPLPRTMKGPSVGEINEMIANAKLSKAPPNKTLLFESTESIAPGDIFFSHDYKLHTNTTPQPRFTTNPNTLFRNDSTPHHKTAPNARFEGNTKVISSRALSRQSSEVMSSGSSKKSYGSGRTTESMRKFTANRQKSQTEPWFACMRRPCVTSKPPEAKAFDESTFIQKAFVVESLREFWADKHRPGSLNGFTCHKQEAQLLKHLVSQDIFPHILFKGPAGSGKKALTMALLREVYGDPSWNISHDLRYFQIQEKRSAHVAVPLASSGHHMELNVNFEVNASYALMALVKEICSNHAITPEVSNVNFKADCKVMVLYGVDKAAESIQHLIKWIMDCYTDACKLILCCEDDINILDSVKSRCKIIKVDAPVTHEIMEVLIQIARKEDFDLPMSFAAKIATKSKQNLRKAIMALEACKANKYPFLDDQPIPLGWEEVLVELAAEILADPSTKRLFDVRGKFQKLLVDFVHPKLILQKLVEEFLKKIDASLKREVYYWHAYYEKRLPAGTSALLKLEEFVAKFMSICRKANINS